MTTFPPRRNLSSSGNRLVVVAALGFLGVALASVIAPNAALAGPGGLVLPTGE